MFPNIVRRTAQLWMGLGFLLMTVSPAAAREPSTDIINHVKHAVVIIKTYDDRGKPLSQGSGFFIESNRIITSLHVIKNASRAQIKTFNGQTYPVQGIVALNEQRDLALLETSLSPPLCTTFMVAEMMPTEGEEIIVISNPQGSSWKVSRGITEAPWNFQGVGELIRITASISPGSSGGPVVNRRGLVIGIAALHTSSADDLNFALPGGLVRELLPGPLKPLPGNIAQIASK